ncbi:UrcA family protein [Novosphingobium album (ex Hu et al. 2023)]|uniref:UrcA family protein n=1 Tax=Novosphingobium album (ex Hu et al. 2023) TaxID=2930093 RepID=A0ABT0AWI5_9SPHN|nr:UrcA family protein [Novosphingobium album (ex Hu et al. 2023)]MCJ2176968.1 UrcA family protein [Novosphingobium album (ex Hu et al. 2023)]
MNLAKIAHAQTYLGEPNMTKPAIVLLAAVTAFAGLVPTQAAAHADDLDTMTPGAPADMIVHHNEAAGPFRRVNLADLDLSQPADVTRLRHRLAQAVEFVCGNYATTEQWQIEKVNNCRAVVVPKVKAAFSAATHDARTLHVARR